MRYGVIRQSQIQLAQYASAIAPYELGEAQHGGAAIAHALAGRLPGADDDSGFVFETHPK